MRVMIEQHTAIFTSDDTKDGSKALLESQYLLPSQGILGLYSRARQ
jgi:hypothetical protein